MKQHVTSSSKAASIYSSICTVVLTLCLLAGVYATVSNSKGGSVPVPVTRPLGKANGIRSTKTATSNPEGLNEGQNEGQTATSRTTDITGPPSIPGMQTLDGCPAWMAEYAQFHRQQRGQPNAKYLVYSACPGGSGLGDRVRGMMYLTRLAAALNRVVLFTWRGAPHELERYLPPSGPIDWTLQGINGYDYPDTGSFCTRNSSMSEADLLALADSSSPIALRVTTFKRIDASLRALLNRGGLQKLQQHRFITINSNEGLDTKCKDCHPIKAAMLENPKARKTHDDLDNSGPCLFRYLFSISDDVQRAVQQQLVQLYGPQAQDPQFEFVAMHLRIGGMEKEKVLPNQKTGKNGSLMDVIRGLRCISKFGGSVGINTTQVPVLLFTDHHELRSFVREGRLANVITSDVTPTHLARMDAKEAADTAAAISTYVDVALLARARCAIYSQSGFSSVAWMMGGGTPCFSNLHWDLQECQD